MTLFVTACLVCTVAMGLGSVAAWATRRRGPALGLLIGGAFALRLFMASLDPFLHDWDERYHALVAKNLMANPLLPLLRAEAWLPYDYRAWCCNHVWLHKQPLFLWQMALSMKLFGVNELALRLPSAALGSLLIWPVYRLGQLALGSRTIGYWGGVLVAGAYYQLEEVSGALGMDHNDVAFTVYVTASLWAYYEYRATADPTHQKRWSLAVGLFAGASVLCKWLTGLMVFGVWGLDVLSNPTARRRFTEYGRLLAAVATAAATFLPWQLYAAWRFPTENSYEQAYNSRHFFEVLEGHSQPWYYYFAQLDAYYGLLAVPVVVGFFLALYRSKHQPRIRPLLGAVGIVYVFFTLAATKVWSYAYVASPLLLLLGAAAGVEACRALQRRWGRRVAGVGALGLGALMFVFGLRPWGIRAYHFGEQLYASHTVPLNRVARLHNAQLYRRLAHEVPAGYLVFNAPSGAEVEAIFFSSRNVYAWWPSEAEWEQLRRKAPGLAVFPDHHNQVVPGYVRHTPGLVVVWAAPQ